MQGYWTSFIRSYDPNTYRVEGSPRWEAWTAGADADAGTGVGKEGDAEGWQRMLFDTQRTTEMEVVDEGLRGRCEYL